MIVLFIPVGFAIWEARDATGLDGIGVMWLLAFALFTGIIWVLSETIRGRAPRQLNFTTNSLVGSAVALSALVVALAISSNLIVGLVGYAIVWVIATFWGHLPR